MMKRFVSGCWLTALMFNMSAISSNANDIRWPVRFTFSQGLLDVIDWHDSLDNLDVTAIPIGLSVAPDYQFNDTLMVWGGLGPFSMIGGDIEYYQIPLTLGVRYTRDFGKSFLPYAKVGIRYPFAGGDFVDGSGVGAVGLIGAEFLRDKKIGLVVEIGYDSSSVTLENGSDAEDINGGFVFSVGAVF